jgi:hypothetical protein
VVYKRNFLSFQCKKSLDSWIAICLWIETCMLSSSDKMVNFIEDTKFIDS